MRLPVLLGLFVMLFGQVLAGCTGLVPVYSDQVRVNASALRFNFEPPETRLEQIVLNRLKAAFPSAASPSDPTLDVSVFSTAVSSGMVLFSVGRPVGIRVQAKVTISDGDAADAVEIIRFTDTTYQGGKLVPTDLNSSSGAEETAAVSTAESLRAAILVHYQAPPINNTPTR